MYSFKARTPLALLSFVLFFYLLPAQPYQLLHAYDPGTGPEVGTYIDVSHISPAAITGGGPVAVGHNDNVPSQGMVCEMMPNGAPILISQFNNAFGNPVQAEAIKRAPNDDYVVCFFDPVNLATDVFRIAPGGAVIWNTRLSRFHARDIDVDLEAAFPTGEAIYLTGETFAKGVIGIQGLTGTGIQVFANEYDLFTPFGNYGASNGFEIDYNINTQALTVVGVGNLPGSILTHMILLRTDPFGNVIWGRSYFDASGNDYYHGKCLIPNPLAVPNYFVGFEYSADGTPFDEAACMEIDAVGNPVWINSHPGGGFFNGSEYIVNGIDAGNNAILMSGFFDSFSKPGVTRSAFSLAMNTAGGGGIQYNEYEAGGLFPSTDDFFWGQERNPFLGFHSLVGSFEVGAAPPSTWPLGPLPAAFWAVATNQVGNSNCNKRDFVKDNPLQPNIINLQPLITNLPPATNSPVFRINTNPFVATQCGTPKRIDDTDIVETHAFEIGYDQDARKFVLEINGELTGPGTFQLFDMQGKQLLEIAAQSGIQTLDAQLMSDGIYILRHNLPGLGQGAEKIAVR